MHFVIPLVPFALHAGGTTWDVHEIPPNISKGILYVYSNTASRSGSTPSFLVRAQGAPMDNTNWFTALRCYRTATSPNSLGHLATFPAITTGGFGVKFSDWIPPFVRGIHASTGTSPKVSFGLYLVGIED